MMKATHPHLETGIFAARSKAPVTPVKKPRNSQGELLSPVQVGLWFKGMSSDVVIDALKQRQNGIEVVFNMR